MKRAGLREKSPVFYIGKGVVILSLVVTSSLSFVLGFFVGRNTQPTPAEQASTEMPLAPSLQPAAGSEPAESAAQLPSQMPTSQPETQSSTAEESGHEAAMTHKGMEVDKVPEAPQVQQKDDPLVAGGGKKAPGGAVVKEADGAPKAAKKVRYTVQIGAFKNEPEADSLREKLSKKGYKAFIMSAKPRKGEKLHKVMVGEFSNRKEAELLSVRIKKGEGLRAFVTLKAD